MRTSSFAHVPYLVCRSSPLCTVTIHHLYEQVTNRDRVCYRQSQRVPPGPVLGRPSIGTDTMRCDVVVRTPCSSFSTGRGIARSCPGYDHGFRVFCWWWCALFVSTVENITETNMETPRCCIEEEQKDEVSSVMWSHLLRIRITSLWIREKVSVSGMPNQMLILVLQRKYIHRNVCWQLFTLYNFLTRESSLQINDKFQMIVLHFIHRILNETFKCT